MEIIRSKRIMHDISLIFLITCITVTSFLTQSFFPCENIESRKRFPNLFL